MIFLDPNTKKIIGYECQVDPELPDDLKTEAANR
jgi:hypothetical protein